MNDTSGEISQLERDSNGEITTKPVIGWTIASLAGVAVLVSIQCEETPMGFETGDCQSVQLVMTVEKCLELARELTRLAGIVLDEQLRSVWPAN